MEDYRLDGLTIKEHLLKMAAHGHKAFAESLNPGVEHILGLRIPELRLLAVRIAKTDWECYLRTADTFYMEERMLYGMVLGSIRPDDDIEIYLHRITSFVWIINSWSVCDTFRIGGGSKFIKAHSQRLWQYFSGWLEAKGEYERRFGIVMLMQYFVDEEHIETLLNAFDGMNAGNRNDPSDDYYVKMALAWTLSVCYVKFPAQTMEYFKRSTLDDFTYNKTLQKITESYRATNEQKTIIRSMRRKAIRQDRNPK